MGVEFLDDGGMRIPGKLFHSNQFNPPLATDQLVQRNLQEYVIDLTSCRVHDAYQTNLPGTPLTDDLGLVGGTLGTAAPSLQTEDHQDAGATLNYARFQVSLPPEYVAGETVLLRFKAGMITNVADTDATLDIACYLNDEDNSVSADLASAATADNMNTLIASVVTIDFTITPTNLSPGSVLDVRVSTSVNDAATGAEVKGCITKISLLCDTRG
jgi:hypothetical protein